MPMIEVYAPGDLFPDGVDREIAEGLTLALLRAEGVQHPALATDIVARIARDPPQAARTWVLLCEAAEGGWGIAGTAFGREEFAALAKK
jgi:hypothetical protein